VLVARSNDISVRPPLDSGGRFFVLAGAIASLATISGAVVAQPSTPASQSAAGAVRPFQPGVEIDWARRVTYVDGEVVLRAGPVEFLACFPGKEHESIVRLAASAVHIYMALGLLGFEPGHPPRWDEQRGCFGPPDGDLVDVTIEWERDGVRQTVSGFEWLRECEYARTPIDRPWVFTGSRRLSDGALSADHGGDGIAVVDKPDSLLALSRNHVSRDAELWAEANTAAIPPTHTRVRVVLRPARLRAYDVQVDFRGAAFVDGRFVHPEDLADLIKLARQLSPERIQTVRLRGTLRADAEQLRQRLLEAGVSRDAFRLVGSEPTAEPISTPGP
jgi:hypothetical protein